MSRTLDEWVASLPAAERRRVEVRAAELIAEEMSLRDLHQSMKKTQRALARRLKVRQHGASKTVPDKPRRAE